MIFSPRGLGRRRHVARSDRHHHGATGHLAPPDRTGGWLHPCVHQRHRQRIPSKKRRGLSDQHLHRRLRDGGNPRRRSPPSTSKAVRLAFGLRFRRRCTPASCWSCCSSARIRGLPRHQAAPQRPDRLTGSPARLGHPEVTVLPDVQAGRRRQKPTPFRPVAPENRRSTLLLWLAFFTTMFGFYFVNSWTPRLLVTAGMTESQGITGGLMLTLGGIFGALLYGALATKWNSKIVLVAFTVLSAGHDRGVHLVRLRPRLALGRRPRGHADQRLHRRSLHAGPFPLSARYRSTGVGWGIGIGRIGAIMAPLITGALLDASWSAVQLYLAVGVGGADQRRRGGHDPLQRAGQEPGIRGGTHRSLIREPLRRALDRIHVRRGPGSLNRRYSTPSSRRKSPRHLKAPRLGHPGARFPVLGRGGSTGVGRYLLPPVQLPDSQTATHLPEAPR